MFMAKKPVSITLDEANLLWLRGRAAGRKKRSLSDAIDEILTEARHGGHGADAPRSVMGTIDIAIDDPNLDAADAAVRGQFDDSTSRPFIARETPPAEPAASRRPAARKVSHG